MSSSLEHSPHLSFDKFLILQTYSYLIASVGQEGMASLDLLLQDLPLSHTYNQGGSQGCHLI